MPLTKSLKKLEKTKSSDKLHPKGRKFKQLNRASNREEKISAQKKKSRDLQHGKTLRMRFFQDCVANTKKDQFSPEELHIFVEEYLNQKQAQIDELNTARRKNPKTTKQDLLEMGLKQDRSEYARGFTVPNLADPEVVKRLVAWKGDFSGMGIIRTIELKQDTVAATGTAKAQDDMQDAQ